MTDINKNSRINKRSLFNDLDDKKKKIIKNVKSSSLNNLNIITRKAFNLERTSKENLTLIEFIKQKNKFFIESSFDVNGTREFLASKEVAMRAIKLNDEIIEEKKENEVKKSCFTNKNLVKIDIDNYNNDVIKKKSTKNANKRTISPRKSRKNAKIKMKLDEDFSPKKNTIKPKKKSNKKVKFKKSESKVNSSNLNSSDNDNDNENNIIFDKPDNESLSNIYKFFIDNANESEENFNKKLKKELKKVENMKQNKEKSKEKAVKVKRKSLSKKDLRKRPKRMNSVSVPKNETQSAFIFSEINKNLMKDDIDVSSIGENDTKQNTNEKKKMVRRAYGSIQINNRQVKENIYKQMEKESKDKDNNNDNLIVGKEDINSDKDSIISILSDLM